MTIETATHAAGLELGTVEAREPLLSRFLASRRATEALAAPLSPEDACVQSAPECSPAKWHLAHTTWFYEQVVLEPQAEGYQAHDERYNFLYNSYYNTFGERQPRARRGLLTRPSLQEAHVYRRTVEREMLDFLQALPEQRWQEVQRLVELGIQHEQQHQELLLTDVKHLLSCSPLLPAYAQASPAGDRRESSSATPLAWRRFAGGLVEIGRREDAASFGFDNESPRHKVFLEPFELASRPVNQAEMLAFVQDGGYRRPELWLDAGWAVVQEQGWNHPFYWTRRNDEWQEFTLHGLQPLDLQAPMAHLSLYEADAVARWMGARLPTEREWEHAADELPVRGNFQESGQLRPVEPQAEQESDDLLAMFGDVWEWTGTQYRPYPGYRAPAGALGEYNGKFMSNQFVLRGGSCASPQSHLRATYRNFFAPEARWQFSGLRLARGMGG